MSLNAGLFIVGYTYITKQPSLKGHGNRKIDFFFKLDSISRHNSKTLHVFRIFDFDLEPAQIFENVPSPVLAKSPTGIGQFANRYWPIRQPVLANSPTGIDEIVNRYWPIRQPVLAKSPTGIDQIANRYWPIRQPVLANSPTCIDQIVYYFLSGFFDL